MRTPFLRFAIRLQTVIEIVQQGSNGHITHPVAHAVEFLRQVPGTLTRPEERRLRIAPRGGLQQFLQVVTQSEIVCFDQMPSATSPTNALWRPLVRWQASWLLEFSLAGPERSPRKTGGLSNESETPSGQTHRLTSGPLSPHPLGQERRQECIFLPNRLNRSCLAHTISIEQVPFHWFKLFLN